MKKVIFILLLCALSGVAYAVDQQGAASKPQSIVSEDDNSSAPNVNALNHDVQNDEDDNAFTPPAEDAENGRLSMNQVVTRDDDYN